MNTQLPAISSISARPPTPLTIILTIILLLALTALPQSSLAFPVNPPQTQHSISHSTYSPPHTPDASCTGNDMFQGRPGWQTPGQWDTPSQYTDGNDSTYYTINNAGTNSTVIVDAGDWAGVGCIRFVQSTANMWANSVIIDAGVEFGQYTFEYIVNNITQGAFAIPIVADTYRYWRIRPRTWGAEPDTTWRINTVGGYSGFVNGTVTPIPTHTPSIACNSFGADLFEGRPGWQGLPGAWATPSLYTDGNENTGYVIRNAGVNRSFIVDAQGEATIRCIRLVQSVAQG